MGKESKRNSSTSIDVGNGHIDKGVGGNVMEEPIFECVGEFGGVRRDTE